MELASKSAWLNGKASGHESKGTKGLWFKAPKVSIEIKRIQAGMLGEQGGNSRCQVSRVEMK